MGELNGRPKNGKKGQGYTCVARVICSSCVEAWLSIQRESSHKRLVHLLLGSGEGKHISLKLNGKMFVRKTFQIHATQTQKSLTSGCSPTHGISTLLGRMSLGLGLMRGDTWCIFPAFRHLQHRHLVTAFQYTSRGLPSVLSSCVYHLTEISE